MASVCMIAYTFYASDPRVRREAEALVGRGDTVHFICVRDPDRAPQRELHGIKLYPLRVGRYRGDSNLVYLFNYLSFFVQAFALVTALFLRHRYQVVQVHTMPDFLVFAAALPKWLGAKIVLDVHDLMPELYVSKFKCSQQHPVIRFLTWMERRSIAFAHKAIAVHATHRDALVAHGSPVDKFSILLNVPDPRIFSMEGTRQPDGRFRLIYHGTVARRHGLETAIRAVVLIRDHVPGRELLVIGDGDDFQRVKQVADGLRLQETVRFLGRMPVEELPQHLVQADVGLVPILYDDFTRYMLPLKLMEYAGMNIPAIVSRTETIEAYFDDAMVCFVTPGSERELAEAILALHRDPARRARMVAEAGRFNARYNWTEHKNVYFDLIDSLLPAHSASRTVQVTPANTNL